MSRTSLFLGVAFTALLASAAPAHAQTIVTASNPNGWIFYDGGSTGTNPAVITSAQPFNGSGSIQYTITGSSRQPSAAYVFGSPLRLSELSSYSFGYSFLTPDGTVPAASPTLRLFLTGLSGFGQTNRTDGSFGWYLNGTSNSWQTFSFTDAIGDMFLRIGGVGQAGLSCATNATGSSFDDRRQTINTWLANCTGANGTGSLLNAAITAIQVDWGTFATSSPTTTYADMVNFDFAGNSDGNAFRVAGNYNFETNVVPEPSTYALMGLGLGALGMAARRRRSAKAS